MAAVVGTDGAARKSLSEHALEIYGTKKKWSALLGVGDLTLTCLVYFAGGYSTKISWFESVEILSYDVNISMFDVFLLSILRCVLALVLFALTSPAANKVGTQVMYWVSGSSVILTTAKFFLVCGVTGTVVEWWQIALPILSTVLGGLEHRRNNEAIRVLVKLVKALEDDAEKKRNEVGGKSSDIESQKKGAKKEEETEDPRARFYDGKNSNTLKVSDMLYILRPYFWPKGFTPKVRAISTFFIMMSSKACNILAPLFIGQATQQLVTKGEVPWVYLFLYFLAGWLSGAFKELQKLVYLKVKQKAFAEIAESTFSHLHSLSLDWHLKKKIGHVLRIMDRGISSADSVMNYLVLYLIPSLIECAITFVIFYVRFQSPQLAVVAFLSFSIYVVLTVKITMWRKKFRKKANRQDNKYHDIATDSLINFETVKYFATEEREKDRFIEAVGKFQKHTVSTQASLGLLNTLQQLDIKLTTFFGLGIMAIQILQTKGSNPADQVGDFVSVLAYISQLFAPLSFLGTIYGVIIQAMVDMTNLSELLKLRPDIYDVDGAKALQVKDKNCGASIEFENVVFQYPGEKTKGIHGISFTCKAGSKTAIVGHTGAGKTTVSRLLFRFYNVTAGKIKIDGQDISSVTQKTLRGSIGVVPQDTVLFNESIRHNIRYGNQGASDEELETAARNANILEFILSLGKQWETHVGERGLKLSGGEKQRVAIARCLLKDPPIVVLDEATSALDSITEMAIQNALSNLTRGRTQLVIAHRLSTIQDSDQIIVLKDGLIHEKGTHQELMQLDGEYAKSWNAQTKDEEEVDPEDKDTDEAITGDNRSGTESSSIELTAKEQ